MSDESLDALRQDFDIRRELGTGSMATVYLAREKALGREVAIKVLRPGKAHDETARKRFEREAKAAASLLHPNVVQVYRFGRLPDETPYLVMRYVKGRTMEERLAAEGPLPPELAIPVLRDVAAGLAAAHAHGIVHRDVRPANVLWDEDNEVALLADFGIVAVVTPGGEEMTKLTRTGQLIGDPRYLSPEQLLDKDLTSLADIYSFAILAYELMTGDGPYDAKTNTQWITAHLKSDPRDLSQVVPDIPPNVAKLLSRCLNREPNHRPAAADIVRGLDGEWQVEAPGGPIPPEGDVRTLFEKKVPQVVGLGTVAAGFIIGSADLLRENYEWVPAWAVTEALVTGGAIVLLSAVLAWFHGERGRQKATAFEYLLLGGIGIAWLLATIATVVYSG